VLYAVTDFLALAWAIYVAERELHAEITEEMNRRDEGVLGSTRPKRDEYPRFRFRRIIPLSGAIRGTFEFIIPVIVGLFSIALLTGLLSPLSRAGFPTKGSGAPASIEKPATRP
jgi:hypothetical protein